MNPATARLLTIGGIGLAVILVVAVIADQLNLFGFSIDYDAGVSTDEVQEVELVEPPVVRTITPIDLGCKALVEVEQDMKGHERRRVTVDPPLLPPYTKTLWTNSTTLNLLGDTLLCVDGSDTEAWLEDRVLYVEIGANGIQTQSPRVTHINGESLDEPHTISRDPAIGERMLQLYPWVSADDTVTPRMLHIATHNIGNAGCVAQAVEVLVREVEAQYAAEAARHSDTDYAVVTFADLPQIGTVSSATSLAGDIGPQYGYNDGELEDLDLELTSFDCAVTLVDGEPVVG